MTNEEATLDARSPEEIARDYYVASGRANSAPSQATLDRIDATERVSQAPTHPPAPTRRTRSDKGVPKKPPADPDEITLKLTLTEARMVALGDPDFGIAQKIQDQIIAHLQKRIDSLTKQK